MARGAAATGFMVQELRRRRREFGGVLFLGRWRVRRTGMRQRRSAAHAAAGG